MLAGWKLVTLHPRKEILLEARQVALATAKGRGEQPAPGTDDQVDRKVGGGRLGRGVHASLLDDLRDRVHQAIALVESTPPRRHRLVDDDAGAIRILLGESDERADSRLDRSLGWLGLHGAADLPDQQLAQITVGRQKAVVLVGEIFVEGGPRHAGVRDHVRHIRARIAVAVGCRDHARDQAFALRAFAIGRAGIVCVAAHGVVWWCWRGRTVVELVVQVWCGGCRSACGEIRLSSAEGRSRKAWSDAQQPRFEVDRGSQAGWSERGPASQLHG